MIDNLNAIKKIVAIVPARSGSKGITKKNIRSFDGHPLLGYTIKNAIKSGIFDKVFLTTDCEEMASIGRKYGAEVPFIRPKEFATDTSAMIDVIKHALNEIIANNYLPDIIILLQPTSPFRRNQDIVSALALMQDNPKSDSVISVELVPQHYSPHYVVKINNNKTIEHFMPNSSTITRRQDTPLAYTRNGQFYIIKCSTIMKKKSIYGDQCLPYITSHNAVNLDTEEDWLDAMNMLDKHNNKNE